MTAPATSPLALGSHVPQFDLPATDGKRYTTADFQDTQILAVVFLANHCPYVGAWEERLLAIAREFGERGVRFVAISSNDITKLPKDSPEEMARRAEQMGYPFPYLYDEDGAVARSFGATRTPELFVFGRDATLRYHGAIDSDWEEGPDRHEYLRDALDALLAGREVSEPETKPLGCVIKPRD